MERQTLVFVTERETKNTVRFQEEASGKPPVIVPSPPVQVSMRRLSDLYT